MVTWLAVSARWNAGRDYIQFDRLALANNWQIYYGSITLARGSTVAIRDCSRIPSLTFTVRPFLPVAVCSPSIDRWTARVGAAGFVVGYIPVAVRLALTALRTPVAEVAVGGIAWATGEIVALDQTVGVVDVHACAGWGALELVAMARRLARGIARRRVSAGGEIRVARCDGVRHAAAGRRAGSRACWRAVAFLAGGTGIGTGGSAFLHTSCVCWVQALTSLRAGITLCHSRADRARIRTGIEMAWECYRIR